MTAAGTASTKRRETPSHHGRTESSDCVRPLQTEGPASVSQVADYPVSGRGHSAAPHAKGEPVHA